MSHEFALYALIASGGLIIVLLTIIFFSLGIILYILTSIGLYKLSISQNIENPWLAWIPVADMYIVGNLLKISA